MAVKTESEPPAALPGAADRESGAEAATDRPEADGSSTTSATGGSTDAANAPVDADAAGFGTSCEDTRVGRLLERRAFPVRLDEFGAPATEVDGVAPVAVKAILRAAAERGLVEVADSRATHRRPDR